MSPYIQACVLCGHIIYSSRAWLQEYRRIYSQSVKACLSGVGSYNEDDDEWDAPSDSTAHWATFQKYDEDVSLTSRRAVHGTDGHVIHEACYWLLWKSFKPEPIPLDRLLQILDSLPRHSRTCGVGWGHDYGRLLTLDIECYYPWYEQFYEPHEDTSCFLDAEENPLEIPELPAILAHRAERLPDLLPIMSESTDCFSSMPWELLEKIAILLPTCDALNLRRSCKSFLPIIDSFTFWLSRFKIDNERGHVFEAEEIKDASRLCGIYRLTGAQSSSAGLRNRRRIWRLAYQIAQVARQHEHHGNGFRPNHQKFSSEDWIRVSGDEQTLERGLDISPQFEQGCHPTDSIVLDIPRGLSKIGISTARLGSASYVTGVRLMADRQPEAKAGYVSDFNEYVCDCRYLHGFRVAVGLGGIRAIQILGEVRRFSSWIGQAAGFPVSDRLTLDEPVESIEVTIDGFKITGIAIREPQKAQTRKSPTMSLRQAALWYPRVPEDDLYLNASSFTGWHPVHSVFSHLYGVVLVVNEGSTSARSKEPHSTPATVLYMVWSLTTRTAHGQGRYPVNSAVVVQHMNVHFLRLKIPLASEFSLLKLVCRDSKQLARIKLITNHGAVLEAGKFDSPVVTRVLSVADGTTLTGFYAQQDMESTCLNSLGLITEMLDASS